MSAFYEEIDESGDLLIILRPSTEPFAPWKDEDEDFNYVSDQGNDEEVDEATLLIEMEEARQELPALQSDMEIAVRAIEEETTVESQTSIEQDSESANQAPEEIRDVGEEEGEEEGEEGEEGGNKDDATIAQPEYKFLVSSHILRRASRVFHKDLDPNGPWKQPEMQPDGLRHKHLEGFDPEAFKHVLNLVHFRNSRVPQWLEMEALAKVAVIVNYFQCHEAVSFAVQSWMDAQAILLVLDDLKLGRPLILWLFIATVFKSRDIVKKAGKMIVQQIRGPFNTFGLPISEHVVSKLDKTRNDILYKLLTSLYELREHLSTGDDKCLRVCDLMALGTVQKHMRTHDVYPWPNEPYYGVSVLNMQAMVGEVTAFLENVHEEAELLEDCDSSDQFRTLDTVGTDWELDFD